MIVYLRDPKNSAKKLLNLGIHPICSHQTQALLLMPRSTYWQEPGIDVRVIQIQLSMLAANHQTEHGDHNEGAKERPEEAKRGCNLMGRTLPTNQILYNSHGLKHQPLCTH